MLGVNIFSKGIITYIVSHDTSIGLKQFMHPTSMGQHAVNESSEGYSPWWVPRFLVEVSAHNYQIITPCGCMTCCYNPRDSGGIKTCITLLS